MLAHWACLTGWRCVSQGPLPCGKVHENLWGATLITGSKALLVASLAYAWLSVLTHG